MEQNNRIFTPASCRFCGTKLQHTFVDLGMSPLCESYVSADKLNQMEPFYPLHVYVCDSCFLVQLEEYSVAALLSVARQRKGSLYATGPRALKVAKITY